MEFFEKIEQLSHRKPSPAEMATTLLEKLAQGVAAAPEISSLDSATYIELYKKRLEKARKSYAKALQALSRNEVDNCIEACENGLLQLDLAHLHSRSLQTSLMQDSQTKAQIDLPDFPEGGCEEIIRLLSEAICKVKQFVEYKGLSLSKALKSKLSASVQSLQDGIENYARADHATASDVGAIGMLWLQYVYARLGGDQLITVSDQPKKLRSLFQLAYQAGLSASHAVCETTEAGREKVNNLEKFLAAAIESYLDNDASEMDKFIRLGMIEAAALATYADRKYEAKSMGEIDLNLATTDDGNSASHEEERAKGSFKRITQAVGELIDRHHPKPHKAAIALRELQSGSLALRRAMRNESWQEANRLIEICRAEKAILWREIGKMTD